MQAVRRTAKHQEWAKDYYAVLRADPVRWQAKNARERLRAQSAAVKKKRKRQRSAAGKKRKAALKR